MMRRLSFLLIAVCLFAALFVLPPAVSVVGQGSWSHTFNFVGSDQDWVARFDVGSAASGVWTNSVGWEDAYWYYNPTATSYREIDIHFQFPATQTITSVTVNYSFSLGDVGTNPDGSTGNSLRVGSVANLGGMANVYPIPSSPYTTTGSFSTDNLRVQLWVGFHIGDTADPGGSATITSITVEGTGSGPFSTPTPTPQPPVGGGWTHPVKAVDRANIGEGGYGVASGGLIIGGVPFSGNLRNNVIYTVSPGVDIHSVYPGEVQFVLPIHDCAFINNPSGFCEISDSTPSLGFAQFRYGEQAGNYEVTVELTNSMIVTYAVSSPTVAVGDTIGAGCVIGKSVRAMESVGGLHEASYGLSQLQATTSGGDTFDARSLFSEEPGGQSCKAPEIEDRPCRLVANSEFVGGAGAWDFEQGPGAPSTYAVEGRGLMLLGGVSQALNLDPGVNYEITIIYRKLTTQNPMPFEVTLGNEIPISIFETTTPVGVPITYTSTAAAYDPTSTGGGGNFYTFKLKANIVLNDPQIRIDYACVSEEGEGDPQPPGGCLLFNHEFDGGSDHWTFTGTVPPAFFAGIVLIKGNGAIAQDVKLFPASGGPQTYKITVVARRVGAPAAGEYIDVNWDWGMVDSGSMGPFADYTFRTASDDTFVVSGESTETLSITIDTTNSASSDMLQIDSLCITTEDGVPVPGYQRAPVIASACKQCVYVPTGDVNEDITEYVAWLACFLAQLWECAFKGVLAGIWTVLTNILTFLGFFRLWLGYIFESGATWTNGNVIVVANWFGGQFWNLAQRLENALVNVRFGTIITTSGASFWDVLLELLRQIGAFFTQGFDLLSQVIEAIQQLATSFLSLVVSLLGLLANFVIAGIGTLVGGAVNMIAALYNGFNSALVSPIPGALTCDQPGTMLYYPCLGMYILDNTAFAGPAAYLLPIALGIVAIRLLLWGLGKIRAVIAGVAA